MNDMDLIYEFVLSQLMNADGEVSPGQNRAWDRMMDPGWGMLTGGYDFMSAVEPSFEPRPFEPYAPLAESFLTSGDEAERIAAQAIAQGMTPGAVQRQLREAAPTLGLDEDSLKRLERDIDALWSERDKVQREERDWSMREQERIDKERKEWQQSQPWGQAGLPNPTDQYTADMMAGEGQAGRRWDERLIAERAKEARERQRAVDESVPSPAVRAEFGPDGAYLGSSEALANVAPTAVARPPETRMDEIIQSPLGEAVGGAGGGVVDFLKNLTPSGGAPSDDAWAQLSGEQPSPGFSGITDPLSRLNPSRDGFDLGEIIRGFNPFGSSGPSEETAAPVDANVWQSVLRNAVDPATVPDPGRVPNTSRRGDGREPEAPSRGVDPWRTAPKSRGGREEGGGGAESPLARLLQLSKEGRERQTSQTAAQPTRQGRKNIEPEWTGFADDLERRIGNRDQAWRQLQAVALQAQGRSPFQDAMRYRLGG